MSNYDKLVSLAFDMMEFLYLYGDSSDMEVLRWNVDDQTKLLQNSGFPGHNEFGTALKAAWDNGGYRGREIFLFRFKKVLIGGTSPLSLFFTNPNLMITYQGLSKNHKLFDSNTPMSLGERERECCKSSGPLPATWEGSRPPAS